MILLICLCFPAVLAVWIYEKLTKTDLKAKQWCYHFCLYATAVNLACFLVKRFVLGTGQNAIWNLYDGVLPVVAANYLIMAIPFAVAAAVGVSFLARNVEVALEDESDSNK